MPLEQHAWILDSSAVMASCFISTGRAMSISVWPNVQQLGMRNLTI
ncbi:hypothetical protein Gohar_016635 [Gossypium harknessii]|uniref:Uncharacterized protein n=1 Tax=Gossypium harknessii TaxID=34285 RepID=A0A7J9G3J4_9ROSI|nr:hypothetical protein [Gossypium harknessii]